MGGRIWHTRWNTRWISAAARLVVDLVPVDEEVDAERDEGKQEPDRDRVASLEGLPADHDLTRHRTHLSHPRRRRWRPCGPRHYARRGERLWGGSPLSLC